MFDDAPIDDGRGRYPDRLTTNAPRGFRAALKAVADRERVSVAEVVRQAVEARLVAELGDAREAARVS